MKQYGISVEHTVEVYRNSTLNQVLFSLNDIRVGDYVLSWNRSKSSTEFVKILQVFNYNLECTKITLFNGASLIESEHQILYSYKSPIHISEIIIGKTLINTISGISTLASKVDVKMLPVINFKLSGHNRNFICNGIIIKTL